MTREGDMSDQPLRVACVQHCAGLDVDASLETLARLIEQAAARRAELI